MGLDHFGVVPDIATFAKGVSSAYAPLAGMAVGNELVALFQEKEAEFQHLYTFSAHPVACAIGSEVMRIIEEENMIARAAQMGKYLEERLLQLMDLPMIGDIRGKGMLWAIEFVEDKDTKAPFPKEKNVKMETIIQCLLKGVFFYPGYYEDERGRGDQLMIAPPFIITEEQIDECLDILRGVLTDSYDRWRAA
jgi:adenosylmethionine-8-amino-7-oxononanoate aminotransferase